MIRFVFCCLFYINSVFYQLLFNNRFYNFFCMLAQLNQVFLFCFVHLRDLANRNTYIGITEFYCIINSLFMNSSLSNKSLYFFRIADLKSSKTIFSPWLFAFSIIKSVSLRIASSSFLYLVFINFLFICLYMKERHSPQNIRSAGFPCVLLLGALLNRSQGHTSVNPQILAA